MEQEQVQLEPDGNWIHVHSGGRFYFNPDFQYEYNIEDIAHALSMICRYGGHCRYHYSVAQHSLAIASVLTDPLEKVYALLHDASEAYLGDIPRPLKHSGTFEEYREIEAQLENDIFASFGLDVDKMPEYIKYLDHNIVRNEAVNLFDREPDWTTKFEKLDMDKQLFYRTAPEVIERKFLQTFKEAYAAAVERGL